MEQILFFLSLWFIQICCLVSGSHTTNDSQVDDGPCMDVNKSYALPRHNPVKVRDFNRDVKL